jgi:hypothetical protein
MFGDPNDVCPMNIIEVPTGTGTDTTTTTGTEDIRLYFIITRFKGFSRQLPNEFKIGVACVDIYYTFAPLISKLF